MTGEAEIKNGDVVRLKSGGPQMTVEVADMAGTAYYNKVVLCVWITADGEAKSARYPTHCLTVA